MEKANEKIEGIFNTRDMPNNYPVISEKYAKGIIKGEVRIKNRRVRSIAIGPGNTQIYTGIEVTIENERGNGVVYIPQEKFPPISELAAMEDSRVEYECRICIFDSETGSTSVDTEFKFLDGKLAGKVYEGNQFE